MLLNLKLSRDATLLYESFRDDAQNFKESDHPRSSDGKFKGKGGVGKNEKKFTEAGVTGDHKIVVKNLNVKAFTHGQSINEHVSSKYGGDKSKALSWLNWYHEKGDIAFEAPKSRARPVETKSTPLTKGKHAAGYSAAGITGEHVIQAANPKASIHGMTVNDFIAQKHHGDEGKALSYLKFYENKGDVKGFAAPGSAAATAPEPSGPLAPHSVSASVKENLKAQVKAQLLQQKQVQAEAKAQAVAAKAKEKAVAAHSGLDPDMVVGLKTGAMSKYHGKTVGELAKVWSYKSTPSAILKAGEGIKLWAKQGKLSLHAPGTKLEAFDDYKSKGLDPSQKIKLVNANVSANVKQNHGKTIAEFVDYAAKNGGYDKGEALDHLHSYIEGGNVQVVPGHEHVEPYDPFKSKGWSKDHVLVIKDRSAAKSSYYSSVKDLQDAHGKTLGQLKFGYGGEEAGLNSLLNHVQSGNVDVVEPGSDVSHLDPSQADKDKKADWTHTYEENHPKYGSFSEYNKLAHEHAQPVGNWKSAMATYSGSAYHLINSTLRQYYKDSGGKHRVESKDSVTDRLDKFLNSSTLNHDVTLTRGFHDAGLFKQLEALKPGDEWNDGAYKSTSHKPSWSGFGAASGNKIVIRAKAGARAGWMDSHGHYDSEHEVLLPRDASLKFVGRTKEGHFLFDHDT